MRSGHSLLIVVFLLVMASCRFAAGRDGGSKPPEKPAPASTQVAEKQEATQVPGGFDAPAYDISELPPIFYPPVADYYTDCLQGPEPDWITPSARLFVWPEPFSHPQHLLCIYGFPAPPDGWGFTVELIDLDGNTFVESFTAEGEFLITSSGRQHWYLPSTYDGVPYIGIPLFFGDPQAEGEWIVSARSQDGSLVLEPTTITVEDITGEFMLSAPPKNPFDVFPLESAFDGQTVYMYLVGAQPNSEYVMALYTIDPEMAAGFGLAPGEPAPYDILAISTLVPVYAVVLNSDAHGSGAIQFCIDASIPEGQYFLATFPGIQGTLELSLIPIVVTHD